jgi:hypothetical protein
MFISPLKIDTSERICLFFMAGIGRREGLLPEEKRVFPDGNTPKNFIFFVLGPFKTGI